MAEKPRSAGKTTIAPEVLLSIAKLSALSVPGVIRLSDQPADVKSLFKTHRGEGVRIEVENNTVYADLFLILDGTSNVRETSKKVQNQVGRAFSEMVGMDVGHINIHVEDITFSSSEVHS